MRTRRFLTDGMAIALAVAGGLSAVAATPGVAAAGGPSCPLKALDKASKPVQITFWQSLPQANLVTINKLVGQFNASQTDVKVNIMSQISYDDTFTKYKTKLSNGDLPDVVMLQET